MQRSSLWACLSLALPLTFVPRSAFAEAPAPEPPQGRIDLSTPPPSPLVGRTYHLHDGFYARMSLGFGSLGATFDDGSPSGEDLHGSSGALGFDVLIGGSPSPGVAIGGGLIAEGAASVDFDRGPLRSADRSLSLGIIGPFIDGFPSPSGGWHLGGMLGLAQLAIQDDSADGIDKTLGYGGAFWVGHDFWVANDWSVGPLLRLSGALTRDDGSNVDASSFSVLFMFTGLYH